LMLPQRQKLPDAVAIARSPRALPFFALQEIGSSIKGRLCAKKRKKRRRLATALDGSAPTGFRTGGPPWPAPGALPPHAAGVPAAKPVLAARPLFAITTACRAGRGRRRRNRSPDP